MSDIKMKAWKDHCNISLTYIRIGIIDRMKDV